MEQKISVNIGTTLKFFLLKLQRPYVFSHSFPNRLSKTQVNQRSR